MGRNGIHAAAGGVLAVCLLCVGVCSGPDPDPRAIARELFDGSPLPREEPLQPVVAALDFGTPPSAPIAESRQVEPEVRSSTILVGAGAEHAMDGTLCQAFATTAGVECAPKSCPDREAIEWMMQGRADFAVVAGTLSARDQHAGLRQTQLGVELWALGTAAASPLRSLTSAQVRKVLTGEVRAWSDLGQAGGALLVYVPADRRRAERAAKVLIPGDAFASTCIAVGDDDMPRVLGAPGAIGVVRVGAAPAAEGVRLLQIDWSQPTLEAFRFGTYAAGVPVTLVSSGQPAGLARDFMAFARTAEGSTLLGRSMLVSR